MAARYVAPLRLNGNPITVVSTGCRRIVNALPARGELWWCELAEIGRRPVVILSRDAAIPRLRRALVAPCTTTIRALPSEVVWNPATTRSRARGG